MDIALYSVGARQERFRRVGAVVASAAAERARIAREPHDVVTHHVTAIAVQADAAQFVATSPERVVTALSTIGVAPGFRSGRPPRPACRGVRHQPAQAPPRRRSQVRQARRSP
ncbi:histidine kinase [Streptosporangium sp. NPDC001559]|uniref:histidine kinase n=1 Tax=Streptosporangium sp. NPDC001559 TaxID=3366187 RepID=UPI0036E3DAD7